MKKHFLIRCVLLVLLLSFCRYCPANEIKEEENALPKIERHFVFETIPLNLEEITKSADRIFTGVCRDIEEIEKDDVARLPVYKYTFEVTDSIKGVKEKSKVTFKQWQPTVRGAGYEAGKKYVLFLHKESKLGLTSPVGYSQGQFEIEKKGIVRRKEVVRNKLKNRGLYRNFKTQKTVSIEGDRYLTAYLAHCSEYGSSMRYKEFVKIIRHLVNR